MPALKEFGLIPPAGGYASLCPMGEDGPGILVSPPVGIRLVSAGEDFF